MPKKRLTDQQRLMIAQAAEAARKQMAIQEAAEKGGVEIKSKEEQFEYRVLIGTPEGSQDPRIIVDYSRSIRWFSMSAQQARDLATILNKTADALEKFQEEQEKYLGKSELEE